MGDTKKDREPERRGLEAGWRRLENHPEMGKGRLEEPGEARNGDREAAEEEQLEEDRHRELAATGPENAPSQQ